MFLISGWEFGKYDFDKLERRMEEELPEQKRRVLLLSLPNITKEINEKKKKALEENIKYVALLSAGVATLPVPGLSFAADLAIIAVELRRYYNAFDLDDPSLQLLSERSGKTVEELKSRMKSPLRHGINRETIVVLLHNSFLAISLQAVEYAVSFIPIIGSVAAGGISFYTVTTMLKRALNDIAKDAENMMMSLLEDEV